MNGLTDRSIKGMLPAMGKRQSVSDTGVNGVRGLSIMANYGGSKIFYFRYRNPQGKLMRVRIGAYPGISLHEARKIARKYKYQLDKGVDLNQLFNKAQLAKRDIHTVKDLWTEYHTDALTRKKSAVFESQLWHKHLSSYFDSLDVRSFNRDTILDFLTPFRRQKSPALAARVQAIISQLGAYAVERRVLEFSPAYQLGKKKPLPTRERYLSTDELAILWNALSDQDILSTAKVSKSLSIALKLALCTCARRAEIAGMERNEFDLTSRTWTLPTNRTKNGHAHVIPLNDFILSLLSDARAVSRKPTSRFVFPGRWGENQMKGAGHIRPDAITRACARLCEVLIKKFEIEKFSPHDLRRTAATHMARALKIDRFTISQILNHTSDHGGGAAVTGIYARYDYLEEKQNALNAWTGFIVQTAKSLDKL